MFFLQDFPYGATNLQFANLPSMEKRRVYKKTTIARAKAAVSKFQSAKRKASRKLAAEGTLKAEREKKNPPEAPKS